MKLSPGKSTSSQITAESGETGKGAIAVISKLRFFYENYGLGGKDVIFMLTTVLARTRTI